MIFSHDVIPYAIKELKKAGYKLVTVAECLGEKAYTSSGAPEKRTVRCLRLEIMLLRSRLFSEQVDLRLIGAEGDVTVLESVCSLLFGLSLL